MKRPGQKIEKKDDNKRRNDRSLSVPRRTNQQNNEYPTREMREDYKYKVIGRESSQKKIHFDHLSVVAGEIVTVRNICPAHQNCGFIQVNNQFSETGFIQKRQLLQPYGQADTSFCFFSSNCKETFSCPQYFEEHLCMEHFYEELKQHITKESQHTARVVHCPEKGCTRQSDDLDEIILHYGVEHHRVQSIAFNHLRRTDIHQEQRNYNNRLLNQVEELKIDQTQREEEYRRMEDMVTEDRLKVQRLEMERDSMTKQILRLQIEVSTKDAQLKEKNKQYDDLCLSNDSLNVMSRKKENEIFHLTKRNQELEHANRRLTPLISGLK